MHVLLRKLQDMQGWCEDIAVQDAASLVPAAYQVLDRFFNLQVKGDSMNIPDYTSSLEDAKTQVPHQIHVRKRTKLSKTWPTVEKELTRLPDDSHFIVVEVGDRATWKDPNCPFRKDPKTKLLVVPTLKRWGEPQKLEGEQCAKADLVSMLFTYCEDD